MTTGTTISDFNIREIQFSFEVNGVTHSITAPHYHLFDPKIPEANRTPVPKDILINDVKRWYEKEYMPAIGTALLKVPGIDQTTIEEITQKAHLRIKKILNDGIKKRRAAANIKEKQKEGKPVISREMLNFSTTAIQTALNIKQQEDKLQIPNYQFEIRGTIHPFLAIVSNFKSGDPNGGFLDKETHNLFPLRISPSEKNIRKVPDDLIQNLKNANIKTPNDFSILFSKIVAVLESGKPNKNTEPLVKQIYSILTKKGWHEFKDNTEGMVACCLAFISPLIPFLRNFKPKLNTTESFSITEKELDELVLAFIDDMIIKNIDISDLVKFQMAKGAVRFHFNKMKPSFINDTTIPATDKPSKISSEPEQFFPKRIWIWNGATKRNKNGEEVKDYVPTNVAKVLEKLVKRVPGIVQDAIAFLKYFYSNAFFRKPEAAPVANISSESSPTATIAPTPLDSPNQQPT